MANRRARGFSLIELLVVIAVILILARMVAPALDGAKEKALRVQCANNLHQFGIGLLTYSNDNRGRFPSCTHNYGHDICNPNNGTYKYYAGCTGLLIVGGYVPFPRNQNSIYFCPSQERFSSHWFVYDNPPNDIGVEAQWKSGPPTACTGATNVGYDYRDDGLRALGWRVTGDVAGYAILADNWTRATDTDGLMPLTRQHAIGEHSQRGYFNILYADGHVRGWIDGPAGSATSLWCRDCGNCCGWDDESGFSLMPKG